MPTNTMTPEERAALLVWHLAHGEAVTVHYAAQVTGLGYHGAYRLLKGISRVVPIYDDEGIWQVVVMREADI
jgi:hypothetical protein